MLSFSSTLQELCQIIRFYIIISKIMVMLKLLYKYDFLDEISTPFNYSWIGGIEPAVELPSVG
jgi:hypothetical protein